MIIYHRISQHSCISASFREQLAANSTAAVSHHGPGSEEALLIKFLKEFLEILDGWDKEYSAVKRIPLWMM